MMERMTRKTMFGDYALEVLPKENEKQSLKEISDKTLDVCINKLGKIEDLMEKYGIKSLKELEEILDDYDQMALAVVQMGLELTKDKRL